MNIGSTLTNIAKLYPSQSAIIHGKRQINYAQFSGRANRLANALTSQGVSPGKHVALLMHNSPEMLESMYGCFKAGLVAVPINFRLHPEEFIFIIDHAEAEVVILSEEFNLDVLKLKEKFSKAKHLITVSGATGSLVDYESFLASASDQWEDVDTLPTDVAWIFYTSGTTGRPKGAMLTHRNLLSMTLTYYADYGYLSTADAVLHATPLSHGSGLYALPNIAKGATNVILSSKSFDPDLVFDTILQYRITNMFAAPTMVKLLVDSPSVSKADLTSLKSLIYGGGPTHVADLKHAIEKLGLCLTQLYGLGETPMSISYLPHEDHVTDGTDLQLKRLASAGIPRTGVAVKIVDTDGIPLSVGKTGEVAVRSDVVMMGYWQNKDATAQALRNGWFRTGDLGYLDTHGYLFLLDRSKDMIISGGENIYPREVEEILIQHPAVREVAVIGIPDPKWGEAVKAVISVMPGISISEGELINFCKDHLAGYKKPKSVEIIDELPKNNYGKIIKKDLRTLYWEKGKRRI